MFLGAYHFDGPAAALVAAYERLMATLPPDIVDLHICVHRYGGLTVFDACPSAGEFAAFSSGASFASAVFAAGLPAPRIEAIGDVLRARIRPGSGS